MDRSRIPQFYKYSVLERLELLQERGILSAEDFKILANAGNRLTPEAADKMVENVIGVFSLPIGLGLNFLINGKDYIVPMVVEEPSIIAAVSSAAKTVRSAGGFTSTSTAPVLIGQIQVVDVEHPSHAKKALLQNTEEIINLANSMHPNMVARGGGAMGIEVNIHPNASYRGDMLIVHLLVDTRDAMGANLVNSMCEGVASLVEKITNGNVFLRILSNLTDRALVRTECTIPTKMLAGKGYSGEDVRDGIILANEFAVIDPYRATTHNKGIMNGIDAVALATGNDWRAIESAAHAYASRGTAYAALTRWYKNDHGDLVGKLKIPMKVGTVGGPLQSNPTVGILHRILNVSSATELAEVMGAVGLAQNFSAIKALSTEGIQQGHMTLHARTVAMAAGATPEIYDEVVDQLIGSGEIKVWKAKEIVESLRSRKSAPAAKASAPEKETQKLPAGFGKIILFGEHAAVYGSHVMAAPIPIAIQAKVENMEEGVHLVIPRWGVEERLRIEMKHKYSIYESLELILNTLGLQQRHMRIEIFPHIPRAMGLGGSAALAVAIIRALSAHYKLDLSDEQVNDLAYRSEQIVHGTPSGIDNTMATYGKFILFKKGDPPLMKHLEVPQPIPIVIGITGVESLTAKMVANVRRAWEKNKMMYDKIFSEMNALTLRAVKAVKNYDLATLGDLMNINQGLLNALQVSSWELEELIQIARNSGALGAKLTGGGGGGAMIALCPEHPERVADAMRKAGYRAMVTQIG
ncbi:MAG: hydroxymethylglutaryl-CoA reductase, degradative [Calditrichaeota bacterium]|nr:hydroxymethylglutaryl-CoA reductase, degradative [Calditrichota bacterium]MCB9090890.1 hydroxymethylglutaryl-CoA reductase, degradative [Calditrichia bacterium]